MKGTRGFTLVELMAAVMLAGPSPDAHGPADSPQAVWGNGGGHERGRGL